MENKDTIIKTPSETDVLCGRGAPINRHSGNIIFRKVVKCNKELYNVCTKKERYYVAESIVQALENQTPSTRFLEAYQDPNSGSTDMWVAISKERAIRKTVQALREKNPAKEENQTHDLRGLMSRENSKKNDMFANSDFDQEDMENWNKLMNHLVPQSPTSSTVEHNRESEYQESQKRQKTTEISSYSTTNAVTITPDRVPSFKRRRVSCTRSEVNSPELFEQQANIDEFQETAYSESLPTPTKHSVTEAPRDYFSPSFHEVSIENEWTKTKIDFDQFMAQEDFGEELNEDEGKDQFKSSLSSPIIDDIEFQQESSQPSKSLRENAPDIELKQEASDWFDEASDGLIIDDRVLDDKWFSSSDAKDVSVEPQEDENDDWVFEEPTLVEW